MKTKKLVIYALFAAITCVATMIIRIPTPSKGYVNMGDAVVLLAGFMTDPLWGALSAAIGSALADIFSGYTVYAPATFIIKGLMAAFAALLCARSGRKKTWRLIVYAVFSEVIMVLGYFIFEALLYGAITAAGGVGANIIQGIFGGAVSVVLYKVLSVNRYIKESLR